MLHAIVDLEERRLWDTLAIVASEAPSKVARKYAEEARYAASESPEALRVQVCYVLKNLRRWKGPRAQQVKKILCEYGESSHVTRK